MRAFRLFAPLFTAGALALGTTAWAQPVDPAPDPPPGPPADPPPDAPPADAPPPPPADPPEPPATPPPVPPAPTPAPEKKEPETAAAAPSAPGAEAKRPPAPPEKAAAPKPSGGVYTTYFDRKLEELLSLPLWGNTTQLPAGVFKIRYEYNPAKANTFFDGQGNEIPLLPPIELTDIPSPGDELTIQPDVQGKGAGHTLQFGYGITDPLDVFIELPFTKIDSTLELNGEQNGRPIGELTRAGIIAAIEDNGRPAPKEKFSGFDLGDIIIGASYNYKRNKHFSAATVGRVFLPTGHPADPDNDFTFLLGPELDRGLGAWTANTTQVFDVRPGGTDFPWVIFNFEVTAGYRFAYERDAPTWLPVRNCARIAPNTPERAQFCNFALAPPFDAGADAELSSILPDLEDMSSTYKVEPGINVDTLVGVTIEPGIPIPIQVGWQFQRAEAVTVRPKDRNNDADFRFAALTRELELFAASELHTIGVGTAIPLFPLYVPASLQFTARFPVAGKNSLILKPNISFVLEVYLPIGDAWMEPREIKKEE